MDGVDVALSVREMPVGVKEGARVGCVCSPSGVMYVVVMHLDLAVSIYNNAPRLPGLS